VRSRPWHYLLYRRSPQTGFTIGIPKTIGTSVAVSFTWDIASLQRCLFSLCGEEDRVGNPGSCFWLCSLESIVINDERKSLDPLREIWVNLASNQRYRVYVEKKDIEVFTQRTDKEGLRFLTQLLPSLGKELDTTYAEIRKWQPVPFFKTAPDGLPIFLGKAIRSALGGDPLAVDCVRQLTYMYYKLEVPHDPGVVDQFLVDFEFIDRELDSVDLDRFDGLLDAAQTYIARLLAKEDPFDIRPCHGSGSTACRTANHEKWNRFKYFSKLDASFSYPDHFYYSTSHLVDELEKLEKAEEGVPTARVVLVPKDSRGPRVISCEPAEFMYIQQGIMRKLYEIVRTNYLTRGHINFVDQGVNRDLARDASKLDHLATLDLSEASDRVSLKLVRRLFPADWVEAFEACRSESTMLPNGKVIKLNKFAPMGSACCFPVEAIIFYSIAIAATRMDDISFWLDARNRGYRPDVYVYGDDIIVPAYSARIIIEALEQVGLKVNRKKSFVSGPFRESCGGEFYHGVDVTAIRIRKFPASLSSSIVTDSDLCNSLVAKFGYEDAMGAVSVIETLHGQPFPRSSMPHPGCILAEPRASNDCFYQRRYNKFLQRYEHRIPGVYVKALAYHEPSWSELLRKELTRDIRDNDSPDKYSNPLRDYEALCEPGYYAEVHSARIKWTWAWLG